jgi:hypothetical protein
VSADGSLRISFGTPTPSKWLGKVCRSVVIQRQLGHSNLGITSVYLQGIDNAEIIDTVHTRRAPMIPVSTTFDFDRLRDSARRARRQRRVLSWSELSRIDGARAVSMRGCARLTKARSPYTAPGAASRCF